MRMVAIFSSLGVTLPAPVSRFTVSKRRVPPEQQGQMRVNKIRAMGYSVSMITFSIRFIPFWHRTRRKRLYLTCLLSEYFIIMFIW